KEAGYETPKPMIPVHGVPMVELVINNIRPRRRHKFIFVVPEKHLSKTDLARALERSAPGSEVIPIKYVTEGAACTVLLARDLIDNDESLMIANSDQYIEVEIEDYLGTIEATGTDGLIMTFVARHPKWSYVRCDD